MKPKQFASTCFTVTLCSQKVVIKFTDASEKMQQDSVACATQELGEYNIGEMYSHT